MIAERTSTRRIHDNIGSRDGKLNESAGEKYLRLLTRPIVNQTLVRNPPDHDREEQLTCNRGAQKHGIGLQKSDMLLFNLLFVLLEPLSLFSSGPLVLKCIYINTTAGGKYWNAGEIDHLRQPNHHHHFRNCSTTTRPEDFKLYK
jgi:hypothetical protein